MGVSGFIQDCNHVFISSVGLGHVFDVHADICQSWLRNVIGPFLQGPMKSLGILEQLTCMTTNYICSNIVS